MTRRRMKGPCSYNMLVGNLPRLSPRTRVMSGGGSPDGVEGTEVVAPRPEHDYWIGQRAHPRPELSPRWCIGAVTVPLRR